MRKPKASIVVPALNEEKFIEGALRSLKNQKNAPAYEIIIADGGSTDRTLEIAEKYADIIVHEPRRTIAAGRRTGALAASGEIMVTANADCYYPPDWLGNLLKPLERRWVVGTLGQVLPKDGDLVDKMFAKAVLHPTAKVLSKLNLHFAACENMAVRRKEYLKVGGFNPDLITGEDTDLIKRIRRYGEVVYAPEAVTYVSMRRVKKWGKLYYAYFHATNFLKMHFMNRAHARYEPIRE